MHASRIMVYIFSVFLCSFNRPLCIFTVFLTCYLAMLSQIVLFAFTAFFFAFFFCLFSVFPLLAFLPIPPSNQSFFATCFTSFRMGQLYCGQINQDPLSILESYILLSSYAIVCRFVPNLFAWYFLIFHPLNLFLPHYFPDIDFF